MEKNLSSTPNLVVRSRNLPISPQKLRPVVNLVRKKEINYSLNRLRFLPHKGARMLHKILQGAVKQLRRKNELEFKEPEKKRLLVLQTYISKIQIDQGITRKKMIIRARGSANTLRKTTSHLFLCLSLREECR
jgi:large subunit ribosomal protein L22